MTLRLIALMSVILLLSLGAFGLLVNYYQDQVMQEVAQTASAVGQATLRTLEFGHGGNEAQASGNLFFFQSSGETMLPEGTGAEEGPAAFDMESLQVVDVMGEQAPNGALTHRVRKRFSSEDGVSVVAVTCERRGTGDEKCVSERLPADGPAALIQIDAVRAESDLKNGLVLKIPRISPRPGTGEQDVTVWVEQIGGSHGALQAGFDEIELPIPVEEYRDLFKSIRDRSLMVFVGVFLVGTVLSAGVASRFTRPIRKLDAGIRQLSDGDLDVQVETHGQGEIARLGRAFNDMTLQLRANRERSREMVRREKLSALGRLAAGVAHDIRNPLHSIGLTLQHLRETCRPDEEDRAKEFDRSFDIIRGEVRRLDQTVGNFLRFATNERRERQKIDLVELIRETATLVRKESELRGIEVALDLNEVTPQVLVDGESIRSSVLNLVLNSFEAMDRGGELKIRLGVDSTDVFLEVEDNGRGIPPEEQTKVFDFAYTTREGGNGLGLAIVHQCIVEEHGGRVSLDSRPGEGTRVRISIPIHGNGAEAVS